MRIKKTQLDQSLQKIDWKKLVAVGVLVAASPGAILSAPNAQACLNASADRIAEICGGPEAMQGYAVPEPTPFALVSLGVFGFFALKRLNKRI